MRNFVFYFWGLMGFLERLGFRGIINGFIVLWCFEGLNFVYVGFCVDVKVRGRKEEGRKNVNKESF